LDFSLFLKFPANRILIVLGAYILDFIFGDPQVKFHPVVAIGAYINFLERKLLKDYYSKRRKKINGFIIFAVVSVSVFCTAFFLIFFSFKLNLILGNVVSAVLLYFSLCNGSMMAHAGRIFNYLKDEDIKRSRIEVGKIVSRSTKSLQLKGLIRSTVESIAENTSDGFIAPLFYFLIGGVPLAILYKSVNTLDSTVGYKNDKYIDFGFFSAKADDVLNFIPARLTAVISGTLSFVVGGSVKETFSIIKKFSSGHESPNSGYPEAAFAGALGLRFGGVNYYFGRKVFREYIGESRKNFEAGDVKRALKLSISSSIFFMLIIVIIYLAVFFLNGRIL